MLKGRGMGMGTEDDTDTELVLEFRGEQKSSCPMSEL